MPSWYTAQGFFFSPVIQRPFRDALKQPADSRCEPSVREFGKRPSEQRQFARANLDLSRFLPGSDDRGPAQR